MRPRQNPTPAAAEETIRRTQRATDIAVQLAPLRTGAEAHRLVGSAACGRRSRCTLSTLAASARRDVALGPPAGCFVFLSAQARCPFTQHEKAVYCTYYESHLVPLRIKAKPASGWRDAGFHNTVLFIWFRPSEKQIFRGFP